MKKKPIIIPVEKFEEFKQLKKLYKGTKNDVRFVEVADEVFDRLEKGKYILEPKEKKDETVYIDYFGEIIPLSEAIDRFMEVRKSLKK